MSDSKDGQPTPSSNAQVEDPFHAAPDQGLRLASRLSKPYSTLAHDSESQSPDISVKCRNFSSITPAPSSRTGGID